MRRQQFTGVGIFVFASIAFAVAVAWGRAGYAPEIGIPLRYVSIALPAFIAGYLAWVVSPSRASTWIQRALAFTLLVLVPVNTVAGHRLFADWYHQGMTSLQDDLRRGVPLHEVAVRHQPFLVHWWTPEQVEEHMRMLREAAIPPFGER